VSAATLGGSDNHAVLALRARAQVLGPQNLPNFAVQGKQFAGLIYRI